MDQTEQYLNSILQKRLGSVINQSAYSKNAHTVTRIPRQQEKVQSMPTVFRKQYETVLMQQSEQAASRMTIKAQQPAREEQGKPMGSHRVEYMAISKRIISKKSDEYISSTVDITKYDKKQPQKTQLNGQQPSKLQQIGEQRVLQFAVRQQQGADLGKPRRRKIFS